MKSIMSIGYVMAIGFMVIAAQPASADGTQINETTGAKLCKGATFCADLKANCNGTYTDATDSAGTPYGKCQPKSASLARGVQSMTTRTMQPPPPRQGLKTN